jgi:hypothetical protein
MYKTLLLRRTLQVRFACAINGETWSWPTKWCKVQGTRCKEEQIIETDSSWPRTVDLAP